MSAVQMVCFKCGVHYIAGVVGTTPWPAHQCEDEIARANELVAAAKGVLEAEGNARTSMPTRLAALDRLRDAVESRCGS